MKQFLLFLTAFFLILQVYPQTNEEQAFNFLNDTLKKDPGNPALLFIRGLAYSETKNYDKAIADLSASLSNLTAQNNTSFFQDNRPVDSADILIVRAYCYDVTNSVGNSFADYRYLQSVKPTDFMYSIAIARLFINHNEFDKAQIEIDSLKRLNENERGLVYQAILFFEMEKYNDASNAADIALKKYPGSIEALLVSAKILGKLNNTGGACKNVTQAKAKITLEYFGGQRGYQHGFEKEIDSLRTLYCK